MGEENKNEGEKKADGGKKDDGSITVVLKVDMHCEGCAKKVKRSVKGFEGVQNVAVDPAKDLVTVKGTMDVKAMTPYLKEKLKRSVEVVPAKKEDGGGKEKEGGEKKKEGGGEGEKKGGEGGEKKEGGKKEGEKKEGEKKGGGGGGGDAGKKEEAVKPAENKMEYYPQNYVVEYVYAPQLFSDENPNACSIM
uniref:HMA domain-containing protein n=1 Tax=Nelumbo nucifera TaxID=4432 RepID=A0A822Y2G7_NELNU|nr:TPA_asm: hypothetical protein HUJ06_028278 [Nelumbo nucifera]